MNHTIFGLDVLPTPALPTPKPDHLEDARRIVRQGLADITLHGKPLVEPGPKPGEQTHAVVDTHARRIHISHELYEELLITAIHDYWRPPKGTPEVRAIWRAHAESQSRLGDRVPVWLAGVGE